MLASHRSLDTLTKVEKTLDNLNRSTLLDLFYKHLNYDRVPKQTSTISIRDWSPEIKVTLSEQDPVLLASGGNGAFEVIYTQLKGSILSKQEQRKIIEKLLPDRPYSLFVFANASESQWHFVNVKYDDSPTRRKQFRRIAVTKGEKNRTAIEQISELRLSDDSASATPLAIQQQHDEAFNVEKVTTKFFEKYSEIFKQVEGSISGIQDAERRRLFTQKLFNRLMFVAFIQKKGWLKFEGSKDYTDYLNDLWHSYQTEKTKEGNFYCDRLSHLFFTGLNNPQQQDIIGINGGGFLSKLIGTVPYLNGGLFEQDRDEKDPKIFIPDDSIKLIFADLFDKFNFTVTESTPLDEEVAVDPEMLGKVFEELVTDRHGSGSYYTPKPIVSFMCREALKGYLKTKVADETQDAIAQFVDEHSATSLINPERVLDALRSIQTVDPAVGSGAYLLGMLHELLDLRECLFTSNQLDPRTTYDRKLDIIQNNLYGVDIAQFAVNIARLRLWLSLAVDYLGDEPKPLPNLKFKIEQGDSLLAPNPANAIGHFRHSLIPRYRAAKAEYMKAHIAGQKQLLEEEIEHLKMQIATYGGSKQVKGFDWGVEFAEVMADGGFDVVVANPPYGATVDDSTRDLYFDRKTEGAQSKDTYGLFIARGLQLLKPGGKLSYIVSDTWRTIKSHRPLRKRILAETQIDHIIDLPSWIFKATVNNCIFTAAKEISDDRHHLITADLHNLKDKDWNNLALNLNAVADQSVDLQPLHYARYTYPQALISSYDNLSFFIASPTLYKLLSDKKFNRLGSFADVKVGLQTGDNAYYLRKRTEARGSYQILDESKLLTDREIDRLSDNEKLNGVDPAQYEGRHFIPYDKGGESDAGEGWLPNYYVPTQYFIDWSKSAVHRLKTVTCADVKSRKGQESKINPADYSKVASRFQNSEYYFREGLTFSPTGVYSPTFRLGSSAVFGNKGSTIFFKKLDPQVMLSILTSSLGRYLLKSYSCHTVETGEEVITQLILPKLDVEQMNWLKATRQHLAHPQTSL